MILATLGTLISNDLMKLVGLLIYFLGNSNCLGKSIIPLFILFYWDTVFIKTNYLLTDAGYRAHVLMLYDYLGSSPSSLNKISSVRKR